MIEKKSSTVRRTGQCPGFLNPTSLSSRFGRWFALMAIFLCILPAARAQLTTADIVGTVTDPTGAAIPNANVTIQAIAHART